jgi:hypothetical protein
MTIYYDPHGRECSATDAMTGGKTRPGFKAILEPGEYLHANITLVDALPKGHESSIDAALREKDANEANRIALNAIRDNRYSGFMPMIDAERQQGPVTRSGADAIAIIRAARYQ